MVSDKSKQVYYSKILPTIKPRHHKVAQAFAILGEAISYEIADFLGVLVHTVTPRISEMSGRAKDNTYDKPILEPCGSRDNKYGESCVLWRLIVRKEKPVEQSKMF